VSRAWCGESWLKLRLRYSRDKRYLVGLVWFEAANKKPKQVALEVKKKAQRAIVLFAR
jgi:hypothetical protein